MLAEDGVTEINDQHPDEFAQARALLEKIIEGKKKMRKRMAALSFTEKIKILEQLRDRERAIAAAGLRRRPTKDAGAKKPEGESDHFSNERGTL